MATQKAINANPIKNDGGVVYSEGTLSSLSAISRSTRVYDNTIDGTYGGALTFVGSEYFKRLTIGNPDNTAYSNADRFYVSFPSGLSYTTGQPDSVVATAGTFWANQTRKFNNLSGFIFNVGDQTKFRDESALAPTIYGILTSALSAGQQKLSFSLNNSPFAFSRRMFAIYTGPVSPTNDEHKKSFYVEYVRSGSVVSSGTYNLDGWHKLNLSTTNIDSVNITETLESGIPFSVGFRDISEATTLTRTISLTTYPSNPYTFMGQTNVTLSSNEKALRISSGNTAQLMFVDIDNDGLKSPVTYSIIPSGAKLTYYPSYSNVAVGEVQGRTLTVEVLQ